MHLLFFTIEWVHVKVRSTSIKVQNLSNDENYFLFHTTIIVSAYEDKLVFICFQPYTLLERRSPLI